MSNNRNINLDILKCIAAFMVVWIHFGVKTYVDTDTVANVILRDWLGICRLGVGCFFVITGFYLERTIEMGGGKSFLIRILRLVLIGIAVWLVVRMFWCIYGVQYDELFGFMLYSNFWKNLLLYNETANLGFHLWYLFALIYSLVILSTPIVWKNRYSKLTMLIFALLWLVGWVMQLDEGIENYKYRNFLFYGMPYIYGGMMARKIYENKKYVIPSWVLCTIIILAIVGIDIQNRSITYADLYLLNLPACMALVILAMRADNTKGAVLAKIGRKYSALAYVVHIEVGIVIATILYLVLGKLPYVVKSIEPFLVFGASIIVAFAINQILTWLKSKSNVKS